MGLSIVLLAAGQGKRMKTTKPKPLVELADKPLIQYSLDTAMKLNPERIILVTGHKKDEVKKYVLGNNPGDYVFCEQNYTLRKHDSIFLGGGGWGGQNYVLFLNKL